MDSSLIYAAGAGVAGVLAFVLSRRKTALDDRQKHAIEIASQLREAGLQHVPDALIDIAVGDYSGAISRVRSWYTFLRDDDNRTAFFSKLRKSQLDVALRDPVLRQQVFDAVDQARKG